MNTALLVCSLFLPCGPNPEDARPQERPHVQRPDADENRQNAPLIGDREKFALSLFRSFVPAEKQDEYDRAVKVALSVAEIVDDVRRPGPPPRREVDRRNDERREAERREDARREDARREAERREHEKREAERREAERNGPDARRPAPPLAELKRLEAIERAKQEAVRSHVANNEEAVKRLMQQRTELMHEVERLRHEQAELVERAKRQVGPNPGHDNPFREGHAPRPEHPQPVLMQRQHVVGQAPDLNAHHFNPPMIAKEIEGLRMDGERIKAIIERAELKAETARSDERSGVWAVERLIEVFGEDARSILNELKGQTKSDVVRRYINVRLAEQAGRNRDAALEPLRELIIAEEPKAENPDSNKKPKRRKE